MNYCSSKNKVNVVFDGSYSSVRRHCFYTGILLCAWEYNIIKFISYIIYRSFYDKIQLVNAFDSLSCELDY